MVTKRIRSEYMKKFKEPRWETFSKCYEEMWRYRRTRRLLEHTHNPWFWGESDTDSESGGRSPTPAGKNRPKEEPSRERTEPELEECAAEKKEREGGESVVPRLVLPGDEGTNREVAVEEERGIDGGGEVTHLPAPQEKPAQETTASKPQLISRQSRSHRVKTVPMPQMKEDGKQNRHPFVLYAAGEKDSDMARRKTHNVRPVASTKEIHESALRAKTRREVERQLQSQRAERRRAKSADVEKAKLRVAPEFNPWLTEYMRCYSARSR